MTKQVLLYENAVPVSSERHRDWSLKMGDNHAFARDVASVPLVVGEFAAAAHEYPIVFAPSGGRVVPVAVLGVANQNLFLDSDDKWTARYIPAFVRRYPFIFSSDESNKTFALCIDEDYAGFNQDGRGERLLDSDGNQTQYCKNVMAFLSRYQAEFARTEVFCKKLEELELLEERAARFQVGGEAPRSLTGFSSISRERLNALPGDKLAELAASDLLGLAWMHLFSLDNLQVLAERTASQASRLNGAGDAQPLDSTVVEASVADDSPPASA